MAWGANPFLEDAFDPSDCGANGAPMVLDFEQGIEKCVVRLYKHSPEGAQLL